MNLMVGWALAVVALFTGWSSYGWPGLALALTVIMFWLVLQFNRATKAMRNASCAPVGYVDSAVMFNARLHAGLPMLKVITLTRSLGRRIAEQPETWYWADASGAQVTVVFNEGRCASWALTRRESAA